MVAGEEITMTRVTPRRDTGETAKTPEGMPLSISLLGPPEVCLRGRGLRFGTKKALALLCYLAVEGKKYPRRKLAELLWPRSSERHARTDLRSTLSRLRKALGEGGGSSEGVVLFAVEGDLLGTPPSSSCGSRPSVRGGAPSSGSFARGWHGSRPRRAG